jgi:PmbA protein
MQGQKVLPDWLDLVEEPHLKRGPGSAAFDDEGVATVESALVERGVLARYVLGSYSARKLGLSSTGNAGGVRNLRVTTNAGGLDELLAEMGTGIYVTELLGQGVNTVTGDYSRGAAGYWVEQGRIVHPVEEITIAANLREMYAGIRAVGTPVDTRGNVRTGPVLLSPLTVAGGTRDDDQGARL